MLRPDVGRLQIDLVAADRVIPIESDEPCQSLNKDAPNPRAAEAVGRILSRPVLGGLHLIIMCGSNLRHGTAVWGGVPVQRCTVHKHRNLLAHAPERLHDEITADYNDMIYAATREEFEARRKSFLRKWQLKHAAVAESLREAGDRLFTFTRLPPPSQWRSARTTNAIERLHEEFKRRTKTQTVLPPQRPPPCCSGHCSLPARSTCERSTAGKHSLPSLPISQLTSPLDQIAFQHAGDPRRANPNHISDGTPLFRRHHMHQSIEILTGLSYLIIGISHLLRPQVSVSFFLYLREKGEIAAFLNSFLHIPLGLLIVVFHNVWTWPQLIVTLVGWSLTLKGTLYFLFPNLALRTMGRVSRERAWEFQVAGAFALAISAASVWAASVT